MIVLGFVLTSIAALRTVVYPQTVSHLLLLPPLVVGVNIVGVATGLDSNYFLLGIVDSLLIVTSAIGVRLRGSAPGTHYMESTSGGTVD